MVGTSLDGNKKVYFLKGDSIANMTKTTNKKREDILESLIYDTIIKIAQEDERGAMISVVVNRIARQHDFTKEEVQRKIDELIANGNLGVERDELGMAYVKVM